MKNTLISLLVSLPVIWAHAAVFPSDIASVVSCNSVVDVNFFRMEFSKKWGEPIRRTEGALWFKASGDMYGSPIREVFVSDTDRLHFVGVVLEKSPPQVIEVIRTGRFFPTNIFPVYDHWGGADGRTIMWHSQRYTKIFCNVVFK